MTARTYNIATATVVAMIVGLLAWPYVSTRPPTTRIPPTPPPAWTVSTRTPAEQAAWREQSARTNIARGVSAAAAAEAKRTTYSTRHFQRLLIEFGNDILSEFGGDLASLGFKGRDLQALPIVEAYTLVHASAVRVGDTPMRRRMLLELFAETEE
jgi:hypothetical protein